MTDYKAIIIKVRCGDRRAQMLFYNFFAQSVYNSALAVVGNQEEAEEIMQDCILKVLTKTDLVNEDDDAMRRILNRMAVNLSIDTLRKRKDIVFTSETLEDYDYEDEPNDEEYDLQLEKISKAVDNLPDTYRIILTLRFFAEMSFNDIASQLSANPATVRVQYTRGIDRIRKELGVKN